ncbi:MAG TPA: hypothetical protein PKU78_04160 [Candidatus Dojkabacteria bacterium]|nr:hypothetical protein [Candidatus Dojkabacteria bacterium]
MYKTHFAQAQYNRERKYTVLTKLISNDSEKYITKEAVFPEGTNHIESIFTNYQLLSKSSHKFLLPKTEIKNQVLWTEFIDGTNIESKIESLLFKGDIVEANKLVSEVIEFIQTFQVVQDNPYNYPDFVSQFDPKKVYKEKDNISCLKPGFYDINFDNIIRKDNKYYFVDFEWCFEYPLPKEYLLLRTIFYLSLKLKRRIHSITSPKFKCYNFFHDIYVPVEWLKNTPHSAQMFQKMLDYEYNLLSKIFISYPKLEKIKKSYKKFVKDTPYNSPVESILSLTNTIENDKKEIAQLQSSIDSNNITINTLQRSVKSKDVIKNHYKHIEELREINRKYQTRSYKTLEKLEKTKIAQFRPLRIMVRKALSLIIRLIRVA